MCRYFGKLLRNKISNHSKPEVSINQKTPDNKLNTKLLKKHINKGEIEIALAILDNYVTKTPGDIKLINLYVSVIRELIQGDETDLATLDAYNKKKWLIQFLEESTRHTDVKYIPELLLQVKELEESLNQSRTGTQALEESADDSPQEIDTLLAEATLIDKRTSTLYSELRQVMNGMNTTDKLFPQVSKAVMVVGAALAVNDAVVRVSELYEEMEKLSDVDFKIQLMKQAELVMNEVVLHLPHLEPEYCDKYKATREFAIKETNKVISIMNEKKWKELFNNFTSKYQEQLKRIMRSPDNQEKSNSVLDDITELTAKLSEDYVKCFGGQTLPQFTKYVDDLQIAYTKWSEWQISRYQEWVVRTIKSAFDEGKEHVGVLNDRKKIAEVIIDNLGEIDQTILQPMVSRLYHECLEYFLGKLKIPKEDQFKKQDSKIRVLEVLATKEKKGLEAF